MKARPQKPGSGDVRGLMAELSDLVDDLGLHETDAPAPPKPAAPPDEPPALPPLAAPPPPSAPVWRSGPEVLTGSAASSLDSHAVVPVPEAAIDAVPMPEAVVDAGAVAVPTPAAVDAVPMWESAGADAAAAGLWEAFSPELAAEPPRPWSLAAATAILEPAAPPERPRSSAGYPAPSIPLRQRRPHAFTVVTTLAVVVAAAVFAFSRLDLGHTSGPATAVTHTAFVVDSVRTVAARSAADVAGARTTEHFPASATVVYLDVTYRNVTPSDALRIVILLQPQRPGEPAVAVSDETHRNLASSGEIAVTVQAPPGGFTPGTYVVRAFHDDNLEQTTTFSVDQPS